jgi:hypothetical protein
MWYSSRPFWCAVIVLVVCLGFLCLAPSWWRGTWRASRVRWRDRAWLVALLALTATASASILLHILESQDSDKIWLWATGMSLHLVAAVLLLLVPLVGSWSRLDFAVPERLRTPSNAPERWAEAKTLAQGNRQERRRKARASRPRRGRGAE